MESCVCLVAAEDLAAVPGEGVCVGPEGWFGRGEHVAAGEGEQVAGDVGVEATTNLRKQQIGANR